MIPNRPCFTLLAAVALVTATAPVATATHNNDPDDHAIRPGVSVDGCTSNFVFTDGDDLFLGTAAHCFGLGGAFDTNGCETGSEPLGTEATISEEGAPFRTFTGTLAYSSWLTMDEVAEDDDTICSFNDFALLRIAEEDEDEVHPATLHFGGPTGLQDPGQAFPLDRINMYGNSMLYPSRTVAGTHVDHAHERQGVLTACGSWSCSAHSVAPGLPGDSGSGVMMADGAALGILVTLGPTGSNGITPLQPALDYANQHTDATYSLATANQITDGIPP